MQKEPYKPTQLIEIELSNRITEIDIGIDINGDIYRRALALVRLNNQPLGVVAIELESAGGLTSRECAVQIWVALSDEIMELTGGAKRADIILQMLTTGIMVSDPPRYYIDPYITIVVATHNRTQSIAACLESMLELDYSHYDIIVVDNAPSSDETADYIATYFADEDKVRYIREMEPGLATAHNAALPHITAPIIAFTDDDVLVDKYWLRGFADAFHADNDVACVTGMIFPAELETQAQMWVEKSNGFNKGFHRKFFNMDKHRPDSPIFPYAAGMFGSGANMAFRTDALKKMDGFDITLGAGSKGVGGDDLAAFFDIISAGYTLVYEPASIVHHHHRREYVGLQHQAYGYGVGLTAYLTRVILNEPKRIFDILLKTPAGIKHVLSADSSKNIDKPTNFPEELSAMERKGWLHGPRAYLKSRNYVRNLSM